MNLKSLPIRKFAIAAMLTGLVTESFGCTGTLPSESSFDEPSSDSSLAAYFINPEICKDDMGPNCTQLRLGDSHLTTSAPAVGKLFSCSAGNPNAPGSEKSLITWIDYSSGTWNLLRKPFLPAATGSIGAPGTVTVTDAEGTRTIQSNNLPLDGKIGDWPMTKYPLLTTIDRNPGTPAESSVNFVLESHPTIAASPTCVGFGSIGVTLNGVELYNSVDGRGDDAVANEIVDVYGGHPAMTAYHYHHVPERLDAAPDTDGHSGIIGYIRDGFALYGYRGVGGRELSNADLDECHGHTHDTLGYHYHATIEYPYTVGCYRGTPR
jgi:hypothetical protein